MKKRMLCLLLALVMTLSLCVPALAADEFAAEAVTEVEEQAPVAPVEPEAPEAEEPAEEPVVDEPAAEEPVEAVEDAPEMASIMPEDAEDLPYLVALGVVSKLNHWELEKTLDIAKTYKAKVDANELYVVSDYKYVGQEDSPAKSFLEAYETAQKCLDGINGVVVDIDVTDASVTEAIDELITYFSKDDGNPGTPLLVDTIKTGSANTAGVDEDMTAANLYLGLKAGASYTATDGSPAGIMPTDSDKQIQYKYGSRTYPITLSTANVGDNTKFTESDWTMSYSKDYLTALEKAQTEIKAFGKLDSPKYKDFAAVRETVLAAAKLEKEAALPEAGDAAALKAAVDAYDKVKDSYLASTAYAAQDANLGDRVADARLMLNTTLGLNGLNTYVRFNDVKQAIKDINDGLTLKANTFKFEKYKAVSTKQFKVTVTIAEFPNQAAGTFNDGTDYGYAIKIGNYYLTKDGKAVTTFDPATCIFDIDSAGGSDPKWANSTDYPNRLEATISVDAFKVTGTGAVIESTNVDTTNAEFSNKDTIQISFYRKSLTTDDPNDTYGAAIDTETLIFPKDAYFGPIIKKAWVKNYNTTPTASEPAFEYKDLTDLIKVGTVAGSATQNKAGSEIEVYIQTDAALDTYADDTTVDKEDFLVGLINAASKRVVEADTDTITGPATVNELTNVYTLTDDGTTGADPYIVAKDMKAALIELSHTDDTHKNNPAYDVVGVITRSSLAVEIDPLSKWGAVKEIKKALAAAKALVPSDYVLNVTAGETHVDGRPDIKTITDAFTTINNDVKAIETNITSTTVANTLRNRQEVMSVLYDIGRVYSYLGIKPVDNAALTALIEEVKLIKEDDYTYDSYGRMHDELEDAEEVNTTAPYLQSEIDAAYKALKAAKDALVKEGAVDKTALTAAIASAKALVEADYTPESWEANKPLIDEAVTAAQAVVDNAQATQVQVNTALNTLTAAVGKLEKVNGEEEPPVNNHPAPASGTGWSCDKVTGDWYFYKNGKLVANYWVGKIDGASQWDSNWYYVGADGKMLTGMQYLDDLHGGYGWYFLQPTNTKQEIGKMLTGYQWVGGQYGECYFSKKSGESGKCTWSELLGNWNGTTWVK